MAEELYEIASMRRFAGLSLARELFETVKVHLQDAGSLLRQR